MNQVRRTRVKICGITRPEDAQAAVTAGADAIGLVFHDASPRAVDLEQASIICRQVPAFVTTVGLFVNARRDFINEALRQLPLGLLQFHGDESAEECEAYGRPWVKALRMKPGLDITEAARPFAGAAALLLDSYRPGVPGGTGTRFDWSRVPTALRTRVILAGGLNPDNVGEAVRQLRPLAVDVSGGVEASPGLKDSALIERFTSAVAQADRTE